jgi:hypothetical protein
VMGCILVWKYRRTNEVMFPWVWILVGGRQKRNVQFQSPRVIRL